MNEQLLRLEGKPPDQLPVQSSPHILQQKHNTQWPKRPESNLAPSKFLVVAMTFKNLREYPALQLVADFLTNPLVTKLRKRCGRRRAKLKIMWVVINQHIPQKMSSIQSISSKPCVGSRMQNLGKYQKRRLLSPPFPETVLSQPQILQCKTNLRKRVLLMHQLENNPPFINQQNKRKHQLHSGIHVIALFNQVILPRSTNT